MKKIHVLNHFGSQRKIAKTLGLSEQAVCLWGEIIPEKNALRIHQLTGGALVYEEGFYRSPTEPDHAPEARP